MLAGRSTGFSPSMPVPRRYAAAHECRSLLKGTSLRGSRQPLGGDPKPRLLIALLQGEANQALQILHTWTLLTWGRWLTAIGRSSRRLPPTMTPLILCNSNGMYLSTTLPCLPLGPVKLDRSCSRPEGLHGGFECCVHSRIWKAHNPCCSGSCPSNITVFDPVPSVGQYGLKRTTSLRPHDL
jgi:hypothetical protein